MDKQLGLSFGALSEPISKQLKDQGFDYDKKKVAHFEKITDCMNYVRFADILTDSQFDMAIKKLFKKVEKHVMEKNKLTKKTTTL